MARVSTSLHGRILVWSGFVENVFIFFQPDNICSFLSCTYVLFKGLTEYELFIFGAVFIASFSANKSPNAEQASSQIWEGKCLHLNLRTERLMKWAPHVLCYFCWLSVICSLDNELLCSSHVLCLPKCHTDPHLLLHLLGNVTVRSQRIVFVIRKKQINCRF